MSGYLVCFSLIFVISTSVLVGCGGGEDTPADDRPPIAPVADDLQSMTVQPIKPDLYRQMAKTLTDYQLTEHGESFWGKAVLRDGRVIEHVHFGQTDKRQPFADMMDIHTMMAEGFADQVGDEALGEEMAEAMREAMMEARSEANREMMAGFIPIEDVVRVEVAADALPGDFVKRFWIHGETYHGVTFAEFTLRDGRKFVSYLPGPLYFGQPVGFSLDEIVASRLVERDEEHADTDASLRFDFVDPDAVKSCWFLHPTARP